MSETFCRSLGHAYHKNAFPFILEGLKRFFCGFKNIFLGNPCICKRRAYLTLPIDGLSFGIGTRKRGKDYFLRRRNETLPSVIHNIKVFRREGMIRNSMFFKGFELKTSLIVVSNLFHVKHSSLFKLIIKTIKGSLGIPRKGF